MEELETNHSYLKAIIGGGVSVVLAFLFSLQFRLWLEGPTAWIFVFLIVLLVAWLTVTALKAFFIPGVRLGTFFIMLDMVALWLALSQKFSFTTLLAVLVLFLFFILALIKGHLYIRNAVKLKFFRITRRIIGPATTGLALFVALYVVGIVQVAELNIPKDSFELLFKGSESITERFIPGFAIDKPVDEVLEAIIQSRIAPDATEQIEVEGSISNVKETVEKITGISIEGQERFVDALYEISIGKLVDAPQSYKALTLLVIAAIIFGIIRGIALFGNWIILGFAFILYQLLISFNFMDIALEDTSKEVIVLH